MKFAASSLIGWVLLVLASVVMAAWLLRLPEILRAVPGVLMVFNTALGFAVTGFALAAESFLSEAATRRVRAVLGSALALLAAGVLAEHLSGRDLGLDWPELHRWLIDHNPHPGRMALPTAAAFLFSGMALVLMHRVRGAWHGLAVQGLTAAAFVLGALGVAAQLLRLELVFADFPFAQMALPTGVGIIVSATALWLCWRRMEWYRNRRLIRREEDRIGIAGGAILALIVCAAVFAGFAVTSRQIEQLARNSLLEPLKSRIDLFRINLELRASRAAIIATRPLLIEQLALLQSRADDEGALNRLRAGVESFLPLGFTGVSIYGIQGELHASAGSFAAAPQFAASFDAGHPATLLWDDGFVLHSRMSARRGADAVGVILVEQRLPALTGAFEAADDFAASAEVAVCAREAAELSCVRQRPAPNVFRVAYSSELPMAHALRGKTGVDLERDYRGKPVLAAHGPIGDTGLGMVVKMDTAELYAPFRENLYAVAAVMALMVAIGIWLLRLRIAPLVRRLAADEERLALALDGSRLALWDLDVRTGKIYLDERWPAMVGGVPGPLWTTAQELAQRVHPEDLPAMRQHVQEVLRGTALHYDFEHRVRMASGEWLWIRSRGRVVARDARGRALRLAGTNADINRRKQVELLLAHQAGHDALSGLPNRNLFQDRMARAIARSHRNRSLMAAMYLDIDRFKSVNDSFGHDVGDALIRGFAKRLGESIREIDTAARLGGDEFAVILEALESREAGGRIAEKIVIAMRGEFDLGDRRLAISASLGVAFYQGEEGIEVDGVLKRADEALYQAKAAGRNTYCVSGEAPGGVKPP